MIVRIVSKSFPIRHRDGTEAHANYGVTFESAFVSRGLKFHELQEIH